MRNKIFFLCLLVVIFQIAIVSPIQNQVINLAPPIGTPTVIVIQNQTVNQTITINSSGSSFNVTYNNLLAQRCPTSQVVNGTLVNGTLICTTVSSGSNFLNLSGTNANQDVNINPFKFLAHRLRIGTNATRFGDAFGIANVITQNETVTSFGNIKWSIVSFIADSYGSQPYAGIHEIINDSNTGALSYSITSTRLGVSGLSFVINPEDEYGGLGFPVKVSRLSDDGSGANFQVNGGISTNNFLNVSNNIEASSYSVGGVAGVTCAGDVTDSQNGIVIGCLVSDENLKQDIIPYSESPKQRLVSLKIHSFNFTQEYYDMFPNEEKKSQRGFLAQEVAQIYPESIKNSSVTEVIGYFKNLTTNQTYQITETKSFESIDTYLIIQDLVLGFQEQQNKIDDLQLQINQLKAQINNQPQPMSDEGNWFTNLFS